MTIGSDDLTTADEVQVEPCPDCGSLELWKTAGTSARTTDPKQRRVDMTATTWSCMACDPPTTAWRLLDLVDGLRDRQPEAA